MPWDFALILLILAVAVPWRGAARVKKLLARPQLETTHRLSLYASTIAFQWLAVAVVAWRLWVHGISPPRLGIQIADAPLTLSTALVLSFLLGVNQFYSLRRMARLPASRRGFPHELAQKIMPHNAVESLAFVALATTVALCEEFLYRGFALTVIQDAARGSIFFALLGSSALFALAHIYQGRRGLVATFMVALIFAATRALTGSIAPAIAGHLVADLIAGFGARRLLPAAAADPANTGVTEDGKSAGSYILFL